MNSLFSALSQKERLRILHCPTAKSAWDILAVTYEGDSSVKDQRLSSLEREFENLSMKDNESIDDFYSRLSNVANQCRGLGEEISEFKIVKRIIQSLSPSYHHLAIVFQQTQDLSVYSVEKLIGNIKKL